MLKIRVIPSLLLQGSGLVKTVKFTKPTYLGDPRNIVRIFNDKEVDEIVILDINATNQKRKPNFELLKEIVSEAFMPVGYGGGINEIDDVKKLTNSGIEKICLNSIAFEKPDFITQAADLVGSSSVVVSIDAKKNFFGKHEVFTKGGSINTRISPEKAAENAQKLGAGEIIINSIENDGMMKGYDIELIHKVASNVSIPVIACGGAGNLDHLKEAIEKGGASAVAAGSIFVYQGKHKAVLISYPSYKELKALF